MLSTVQSIDYSAFCLLCAKPGRWGFCCSCEDIDRSCQRVFATVSFDHLRVAELPEGFVHFLTPVFDHLLAQLL